MVIYFDLEATKLKFMQQQNNKKYFVVDFLYNKSEPLSFENILTFALDENKEIIDIMKHEKNYVVLPNNAVSIINIKVPFSKREAKPYYSTKFNLMFPNASELLRKDMLYYSTKDSSEYVWYITKKDYINQIKNTFQKYGVKISGITYASEMQYSYLLKTKNLSKENALVLDIKKGAFSYFAVSKNMIVAHQQINFDDNLFAAKYAYFIKTNYKNLHLKNNDIDKNIEQTRANLQKNNEKALKFEFIVKEIKKYFENCDLSLSFNKVVVFDNQQCLSSDFVNEQNFSLVACKEEDVLISPIKNVFLETIRRFF